LYFGASASPCLWTVAFGMVADGIAGYPKQTAATGHAKLCATLRVIGLSVGNFVKQVGALPEFGRIR
jgi:hypothetical protein